MTPPPDSGGQINPFGMPPLVDADRLDTDHIGRLGARSPGSRPSLSVTRRSTSLGGLPAIQRVFD
jgi:hypothetical protein